MTAEPATHSLPRRLLEHLRTELREPGLTYADEPQAISGGYDTQIFSFQLKAGDPGWRAPLILRLLGSGGDPRRAAREALIQNTVAALGYPAPRVLLTSADPGPLGGAFLIMERLAGRPMLEERRLGMASTLAAMQARLHALDADRLLDALDTIGARDTVTFDGFLAQFDDRIARHSLQGLRPAMAWVRAHRPTAPERASICHGDFHPQNVLMAGGTVTGVLDWPNVVVADAAYDVGATRAILRLAPVELTAGSPIRRGMLGLIRPLAVMRYLATYRRSRPVGLEQLDYYEAVASLRQLVRIAEARVGVRTLTALDTSPFGERVARHFAALTAVTPRLPTPST